MKRFEFEVVEKGFAMKFKGETMAESKEEAIDELKEWYAMELGTVVDEIHVVIK